MGLRRVTKCKTRTGFSFSINELEVIAGLMPSKGEANCLNRRAIRSVHDRVVVAIPKIFHKGNCIGSFEQLTRVYL